MSDPNLSKEQAERDAFVWYFLHNLLLPLVLVSVSIGMWLTGVSDLPPHKAIPVALTVGPTLVLMIRQHARWIRGI